MYNKHNIKILKKRIEKHPKSSPNIWFYYLGIARFKITKSEYSQSDQSYSIRLKLNKWNPLTLAYLFCSLVSSLVEGVCDGRKIYKRKTARINGTSYYVDLSETKEGLL